MSGFVAFFMAPAALATRKGGPAHRRWGKFYFWSMVVVAVTALIASLIQPNYFLAFLSVFSFYLAFSGYRVLFRKYPRDGAGPKPMDWTGAVAALIVGIFLTILGIIRPGVVWMQLGLVAVIFGVLGIILAGVELKSFLYPSRDARSWWYSHMTGMLCSYIAAVSAFSVTNFHFLPELVRWFWPSAIGFPLIIFWIVYYKRKFGATPAVEAQLRD